jgi:Histidinol dehydrogenase
VGDYASGTNHVLPTYGYARMYSGVSLDSFQKKMTVQVKYGFPQAPLMPWHRKQCCMTVWPHASSVLTVCLFQAMSGCMSQHLQWAHAAAFWMPADAEQRGPGGAGPHCGAHGCAGGTGRPQAGCHAASRGAGKGQLMTNRICGFC